LSSSISAPTTSAGASARAATSAPWHPWRRRLRPRRNFWWPPKNLGGYSVLNNPPETVRAAEKPGIITTRKW